MARSTLELLLDSIKDREEEPPDRLPFLPQRPTSRARLPSRKRTSNLIFADRNPEHSNGHTQRLVSHAVDASTESIPCHLNGKTSDGLSKARLLQGDLQYEESAQASPNGSSNGAENGDQSRMMRVSGRREDAKEPTLLSEKQETGYTSLKKRRRVHHIQSLQKDSRVWLLNQQKKWTIGVIQSTNDSESVVCTEDGQLFKVSLDKLLPANPELLDGVDALEQLGYIHELAVAHNLQCRYELGKLCTRAGPSVIALTASKGRVFSSESNHNSLGAFESMAKDSRQPYFDTVVHDALHALKGDWKNQSIIFSGECGSGKTESMKLVLQHLISSGGNSELGTILLSCYAILEAFGNAPLLNSTNASCFGKMLDINFDKAGNFCSAYCQIVSFEKSRVVSRAEGDHSYQVFYQLCAGADPLLKEKLNLRGAMQFDYLRQIDFNDVNEACSDFRSLLNAFHTLGFSEKAQQDIFTLLSAILWLGNINADAAADGNEAVDTAAKLLNCSSKHLLGAIGFGGSNSNDAVAARDFLACAIYERLFYWLVAQFNKLLNSKEACDVKSVSVVDMPGFGCPKRNGLEGLVLNYAHELLHQFTQWHLLQPEKMAGHCGGSSGQRTDSIVDFLELVLFPFLLEEGPVALSEEGESKVLRRLEMLLSGSSCCKQLQDNQTTFLHYFGEVTYNMLSFFKNPKSAVNNQTLQVIQSCMAKLKEISLTKDNGFSVDFPMDCPFPTASLSTGQELVLQMMEQLDNTAPHFVFCIAPSELPGSQSLQKEYVLRQLRINGVVEAVRLCKLGYPIGISHAQFATRFSVFLGSDAKLTQDPLGICIAVLQRLEVPHHMYQIGLTKLFFPPEQIEKLERSRDQLLSNTTGEQMKPGYEGFQNPLQKEETAAIRLQALVRGWSVRRGYLRRQKEDTESCKEIKDKASVQAIRNDGKLARSRKVDTSLSNGSSFVQVENGHGELGERSHENSASGEPQTKTMNAPALLQKREEEIAHLQQSLKEYERKCLANESKMKSMEEMWQAQIASLEQRLLATKSCGADDLTNKTVDSDNRSTAPLVPSARDTPETTSGDPDVTMGRSEVDPKRSVLDNLSKELEHRTQVFNDDAKFLVEVKSGQIEANFKPDEELQKLRHRFDVWKKEYKNRLKETKGILKKLGKSSPDSAEKSKKKWWSRS